MRTIQLTLDDNLVESVDRIVEELKTTRSDFTRKALREALGRLQVRRLEEKHRKGYEAHPLNKDEFSAWENEQVWEE